MSMLLSYQTDETPRAMALSTQESHRNTYKFRPYVYRGNGEDVITGKCLIDQIRKECKDGEHPEWCYCTTCTRRNLKELAEAGAPALTRSTL